MGDVNRAGAKNGYRSNGSRRSQASHDAILGATMELLSERGYSDLTVEAIAARARVGKATIYRWWKSKGAVVGETLARHLEVESIDHSGSVRDELRRSVDATVSNYSNSIAGVVVPGLVADIIHDPDLHEAFREQFLEPRRAGTAKLLERAIKEGLLPEDLDTELVMDIWAGAVFYRVLVSGQPVAKDVSTVLVSLILDGEPPRRAALEPLEAAPGS